MPTWVGAGQKFDFFVSKSWSFCNSKHFSQSIMVPCYWYYFCIFYIFLFFSNYNGFSLFCLTWSVFLMFEDSNFCEFTNFPFKTKYNTAVYSVNSNYLFSREKQEKNSSMNCIGCIKCQIISFSRLVYFFEDIFKSSIISLHYGVLCAHIEWPFFTDCIIETTMCKVSNRFVSIVHSHDATTSACNK